MRCKRCTVWLLVCALLLAGTISSCQPKTVEPTPPPTPTDQELEQIQAECGKRSEEGLAKLRGNRDFDGLMYVENQVILIGAPDKIDQVVGIVGLEKRAGFDLDGQTAVYLYNTIDKTVQQVTCEINELERFYGVWADPNYHLSPAGWIGGGSPWTQNGEWVGNPGGGYGSATAIQFQQQWAWGPQGIHLVDNSGTRLGKETGEGTRIAIFDTSPFDGDGWRDSKSIQDMTLTVSHQIDLIPAPTCPGYSRKDGRNLEGQDISNHGLFVAGLAHAVAPASDIYLIRVLENDGCGTLYQIAEGIRVFTEEILATEETLKGTILNLSLGVHKTDHDADFGLPNDVRTLERVLRQAHDQGAVVVAAAGNDSYAEPDDTPRGMELPAGYDFVFGVAASSDARMRGCFSNAGDVAAPGGNGEAQEETKCAVPACSEKDPKSCLGMVISVVYRPEPGYAYWVGTSFAAPLYSGLQALLFEQGAPPDIDPAAIGAHSCPSSDQTLLPNGIANWARASGENCP